MDNIKDENLKRLGKYIAQEFINLARETTKTDWVETNVRDYSIGELARCVTLQNHQDKMLMSHLILQDIHQNDYKYSP